MPRISIIIRTKNEEAALPFCLAKIKNQTIQDSEVVVVDSGSSDKTVSIAQAYGCKIVSIDPKDFTFGGAINNGIAAAGGDIAVIISAHCLPVDDLWLERLCESFGKVPKLAGVYGRQIAREETNPIEWRGLLEAYPEGNTFQLSSSELFSNANSAFLVSVWRSVSFDEDLTGAEDINWRTKISSLGYQIGYEPRAIVFHSHQESLKSFYLRAKRESEALFKIKSSYAKRHTILGYWARCARSLSKDYLFLIRNQASALYFIKWTIYLPLYRMFMYYGQYRGAKK